MSRRQTILGFSVLVGLIGFGLAGMAADLPGLKVSDNRRFLVTQSGSPFFYLGDTAWELFHRLNREDAGRYLKNRSEKRFTVIQAVVLAEREGLTEPNRYGHLPLRNNDPLQPNELYFQHVDWIVKRAGELGLYLGMLPTWGDKWNKKWGAGPEIFTADNAAAYGEWIGRRYRNSANIIWILGGDRPVENDTHKAVIRAMARGIRKGDGGAHLMTYHPVGGKSSSEHFHIEDWLDFNLRQNGHCIEARYWDLTMEDYTREPMKPVIDGEPLYEDHPICFNAKKFGYSNAHDVRRCLYWDLFAGAFGHTYGNHSIWQMNAPDKPGVNGPLNYWYDALDKPGASQMRHARALLESRPFLTRVPDNSLVVPASVPLSVPGSGTRFISATRSEDGSYAMVYVPASRSFTVSLEKLSGKTLKAWWFDPRTGAAKAIGEFPKAGAREFTPPDPGENLDWILVLDDAAKRFPPPGQIK